MSDAILNEDVLTESESLSPDGLIANLLQDLITDSGPDDIAAEFIDEFVMRDREETAQILAMLETPSETLIELLKGILGQSYQVQIDALDTRGVQFINGLKFAVKEKMTALATDTA